MDPCILFFLDPLSFPLLLSYYSNGNQQNLSEDRSFHWYFIKQILINPDRVSYRKKTQYIWRKIHGQVCYWLSYNSLQTKFVPFVVEKKASQNFMRKKDDKVGNKTGHKRKDKRKKKRARKKIEIRSQNSSLITYNQKKIIYVLSVGNFFQPFHDWPKNGSKRRIWSKIQFFSLKIG